MSKEIDLIKEEVKSFFGESLVKPISINQKSGYVKLVVKTEDGEKEIKWSYTQEV
jgi:hypothetical protein